MHEQQRNGTIHTAALVHEVDVQRLKVIHMDISGELGERIVDFTFVSAPVVPVFPVRYEPLYITQWHSILPIHVAKLIGEPDSREFSTEVSNGIVWDGERKRAWRNGS